MLEIKNATKVYGKQVVLNNVGLSLKRGEVLGFLGPNGAGKSTLMKSILGLLELDGGEIFLEGEKVDGGSIATKSKIGYLPENNPLYGNMYVREYLKFVAECYGIGGKGMKEAVNRVIEQTKLGNEAKKLIMHLSKGYKQRVGLAAAIIHKPALLILDEPMTGLDPNQQIEIRQLIKSLSKDRAIMISTHIMQEVEAMCDRIEIICSGEVKYGAGVGEVVKEYGSVENAFREWTK